MLAGIEQWHLSNNTASPATTLKEIHLVCREEAHRKALSDECRSRLALKNGGVKVKLLRSGVSTSYWRNPAVGLRGGTPTNTVQLQTPAAMSPTTMALTPSDQSKSSSPHNAGFTKQAIKHESKPTTAQIATTASASKPAPLSPSVTATLAPLSATQYKATVATDTALVATYPSTNVVAPTHAASPSFANSTTVVAAVPSTTATKSTLNSSGLPLGTGSVGSSSSPSQKKALSPFQSPNIKSREIPNLRHKENDLQSVILESAPLSMDASELARYLQDALTISAKEAEAAVCKFRGINEQAGAKTSGSSGTVRTSTSTKKVLKPKSEDQISMPAQIAKYKSDSDSEDESPSDNHHLSIPAPMKSSNSDCRYQMSIPADRFSGLLKKASREELNKEQECSQPSPAPHTNRADQNRSSRSDSPSIIGIQAVSSANAASTASVSRVAALLALPDSSHTVDTWSRACHQWPQCPTVGTHNQLITDAVLLEGMFHLHNWDSVLLWVIISLTMRLFKYSIVY